MTAPVDGGRRGRLDTEVSRFLVVGLVAAAIDLGIYLWLQHLGTATYVAKAISFVAGAVAACFGHKHLTFQRDANGTRGIVIYWLLYSATLGLNMLVNEGLLRAFGNQSRPSLVIAWIGAMVASATTNYVGGKLLVFTGRSRDADAATQRDHTRT